MDAQPGDNSNAHLNNKNELDFQKFKYIVGLIKWFIVSVVLVVVTLIIDTGFRDRAAGLQEIQHYDKYVTELLVLNKEIGPRRLLAQYFSHVTASKALRDQWKEYYKEVDAEYRSYLIQDSITKARLDEIVTKDSMSRKSEIQNLRQKLNDLDKKINTPLRLPAERYSKLSPIECYILFYDKVGFLIANTVSGSVTPLAGKNKSKLTKNFLYTFLGDERQPVQLLPGKYLLKAVLKSETYIDTIQVDKADAPGPIAIEISLDVDNNP